MIQARELRIDSKVTISDIYKLVDMPYRITNKSKVFVVRDNTGYFDPAMIHPLVLRVEWEVEKGDPEV